MTYDNNPGFVVSEMLRMDDSFQWTERLQASEGKVPCMQT